ncbi:MAG: hypothetical protein M3501_05615 [Actinomycetota bacterium]|nr:hypothetical protein [Actinomycetota bacterium]
MTDLPPTDEPALSQSLATEKAPRDQRWLIFIVGAVALVVGLVIAPMFLNGDDDDPSSGDTIAPEVSVSGDVATAEDTAVRLVDAANSDDCDTVRSLATERVANELTGEMNCNNPGSSQVEIVDSSVTDDDPVVVSVLLGRGDGRLTIEVEMTQENDGTWLANNFDAIE